MTQKPERILEPWVFDEMSDMEVVNFISERVVANLAHFASLEFKCDMFPRQEARKPMMQAIRRCVPLRRGLLAEKTEAPKPNAQRRILLELLNVGFKKNEQS